MITAERTGEALSRLIEESGGVVSASAIARWAGRDDRTARRWVAGDSVPDLNDLHALAAYSRREDVLLAVVDLLLGPLPVVALIEDELSGSAFGYAEVAATLLTLGEFVQAHARALADGRIDSGEAMRMLPILSSGIRALASMRLQLERRAAMPVARIGTTDPNRRSAAP